MKWINIEDGLPEKGVVVVAEINVLHLVKHFGKYVTAKLVSVRDPQYTFENMPDEVLSWKSNVEEVFFGSGKTCCFSRWSYIE